MSFWGVCDFFMSDERKSIQIPMKYKLIPSNPQDRNVAPKYYAKPVYAGSMDMRSISKDNSIVCN
jgi:hypothetical protein